MAQQLFSCSVLDRFASAFSRLVRSVPIKTLFLLAMVASAAFAQMESATVLGRVTDPSGAVLAGAEVDARNIDTNITGAAITNKDGFYTITSLRPGRYVMTVHKAGFKSVSVTDISLKVQDNLVRNFALPVGAVSESITVTAESQHINTTDAAVSTVIDRNFAENLPMNGRSFQGLVQLAPGVVVVASNGTDAGQFAVNGQRATSNYWTVDGVSANIGIGVGGPGSNGNGMAGSLGSFSALGGTNSLVSVDAMQEFRIQTSTYAPEYGRTPGGQIAIVTRSGTNQFHGTAFDYLRNDALDANNWFNGFTNNPPLPKAKERQNDFGGTVGGPIFKDRTFFFFSYEGLRLQLPQTAISSVPDVAARQSATPAMQPFLNAYPLPNGTDNPATGVAQFNASFSSSATLDASSLRIDHRLNEKVSLFARYNYSPSEIVQRGGGVLANSIVTPIQITTQTGTVGGTWSISQNMINDLRFNYSRTNARSHSFIDSFGGAVPLATLPFPSPFTEQNGILRFQIFSLSGGVLADGLNLENVQRQINLVDTISVQKRSHGLKFGLDFRRLAPTTTPEQYGQSVQFPSISTAKTGNASSAVVLAFDGVSLQFRNLGAFAQDTWRVLPRLTLTYGLRWDVDFAPSSLSGPSFPAVTGYNLNDLSQLTIAPAGTSPFSTSYGDIAPRIGVAYQIRQSPNWQTVFRGGFGTFYDLAGAQTGSLVSTFPPFAQNKPIARPIFPLSPANGAPPVIPSSGTLATVLALNPNLKLPYTLQWNVALEQALGKQQVLSLSYVGAAGRRLLQTTTFFLPPTNPNITFAQFVDNSATSDYDALQVQFQRRLSHGLQAQASYSWAHSIDTGSASSGQVASNEGVPGSNASRGPSDFDIRHALSLAVTYEIPAPMQNALLKSILRAWSLDSLIQARSAPPVDVADNNFFQLNDVFADVRPDMVVGQPLYLFGPQFPGGKAINPAAFRDPPTTPTGCVPGVDFPCNPARQGTLGRNALRGFGATQWDFAVHRDFPLREAIRLQFRAEMFNILNHPNFGQPNGSFPFGGFGLSSETLNQSLSGTDTAGAGSFNPLYQLGGPRSIQFALKLMF